MEPDKNAFFDAHAQAFAPRPWSPDEAAKLEWFRDRWRISSGMTVVEPGCGAGQLTPSLAEWVGPRGRVYAFDPSPEMIAAHQRRVTAANVVCSQAAGEDAALPPSCADRVICFRAFPHFDDTPRALANLTAAMKPDGVFFVAHLHTRDELNNLHRDAGEPVREDRIPPEADMRARFEDAGLVVDEVVDESGRYHLAARMGSA